MWPQGQSKRNEIIDDTVCQVEKFRLHALEVNISRGPLSDFYFRKLTLEAVWRMVWRSTKIPQNCNVTLGNDNGLNQGNGSWDDSKTTKEINIKKEVESYQLEHNCLGAGMASRKPRLFLAWTNVWVRFLQVERERSELLHCSLGNAYLGKQ